nr:hypothetical protein [Mycolicibacter minnesotensis]
MARVAANGIGSSNGGNHNGGAWGPYPASWSPMVAINLRGATSGNSCSSTIVVSCPESTAAAVNSLGSGKALITTARDRRGGS